MLLAALAAFALQAQAPAAEPPPAPSRPASEVAPITVEGKRDPLVCKTRPSLGTIVPKKTCRKKSEVEQARQDGRQITEDLQRGKDAFYRPIEP